MRLGGRAERREEGLKMKRGSVGQQPYGQEADERVWSGPQSGGPDEMMRVWMSGERRWP